ncbi:retrovirus-related pol polyprotein from transposon TNT 1-94 [Tanacetum coccineum]
MEIVHVEEVYIEALQAKYPIIEWEIYSEEQKNKKLLEIIEWESQRSYQTFEEDANEILVTSYRALQSSHNDPLGWRLYDICGVHRVSTERGHEIFMLVEKDYPLTKGLTTLLLCNKLQFGFIQGDNNLTSKGIRSKFRNKKLVKENPDEPSPVKRSKGGLVTKKRKPKSPLKLVDEPSDEGVPVDEPAYNEEDANLERALELSLMEQGAQTQGPARPVVIREPGPGIIQPLPEVQGNGKEKVVKEQAVHDLLTLQTPKKKSLADQFIF